MPTRCSGWAFSFDCALASLGRWHWPDPDGTVVAARGEGLPVRAPRHREHLRRMPLQFGRLLPGAVAPCATNACLIDPASGIVVDQVRLCGLGKSDQKCSARGGFEPPRV